MKYLLLTFMFLFTHNSYADTIYSCKEAKIGTITWEEGGILSKAVDCGRKAGV